MVDLDKSGYGYQRVRTYLGPSLGWTEEYVQPATEIKTGGVYVVKPGESLLLVNVAANLLIQLPDVDKWMQQAANQPATGFTRAITIKDLGGNANNFNIAIAPFGSQAIDNIQQTIVLSINRQVVTLVPLLSQVVGAIQMSGWAIESVSGGSSGGGGGDVFKAGNNTFTGINTFLGPVSVLTADPSDNNITAANTAFVKSQNYITGAALLPYALIASPTFTGDPKAPTRSPGDNSISIATTAFVTNAVAAVGGGAPTTASYITSTAEATLSNERVLTDSASVTWDRTVAGQIKATTSAGGGNVSNSGTPTNGQLAQWTTATTIQGISIASLGFQPLDADLTAISGLLGTNTIYYRSAPDIWSPVTFSGLSFSGGVLTVTAGGGNVNNSGVPTVGQLAVWTDATHIQGVTAAYAPLASPVFTGDPQAPTPLFGDNDLSIATTAFVQAAATSTGFTTGDVKISIKTNPDVGWVLMNDGTIGNSASGSSNRSNADTQALFTLLFNSFSDAQCPMFTNTGVGTTRAAQGSASAAFGINCRMSLPKVLGRVLASAGTGAGLTTRLLGDTTGVESITQDVNTLPAHIHANASGPGTGFWTFIGTGGGFELNHTGGTTSAIPNFTASTGAGVPTTNMPPTIFFWVYIKL